jgi:nitroimidazol reductase NimA-like FMN-containing flavoprotein (pyridoxamine 5'-phosphate oxidase superfamily)
MTANLTPLTEEDCWSQLALHDFGRIAVVRDGSPEIFPLSYRVVEQGGSRSILIRTRAGNAIDRAGASVCFQIDGVDPGGVSGWSVLASGHLQTAPRPDDSSGVAPEGHDTWRKIVVARVSGRRLDSAPSEWSFNPAGYL